MFNLVCGTGLAVGAPLSADPRIAKISFTGSNAVGVQVMQRAAETVKGVSLELGGKSSLLVLADADIRTGGGSGLWRRFLQRRADVFRHQPRAGRR